MKYVQSPWAHGSRKKGEGPLSVLLIRDQAISRQQLKDSGERRDTELPLSDKAQAQYHCYCWTYSVVYSSDNKRCSIVCQPLLCLLSGTFPNVFNIWFSVQAYQNECTTQYTFIVQMNMCCYCVIMALSIGSCSLLFKLKELSFVNTILLGYVCLCLCLSCLCLCLQTLSMTCVFIYICYTEICIVLGVNQI